MNITKHGYENNSFADSLFPDKSLKQPRPQIQKLLQKTNHQVKSHHGSVISHYQNKQTQIQRKKSYSPVSNNIHKSGFNNQQLFKHKTSTEQLKTFPKNPSKQVKPVMEKKVKPFIERSKPKNKEEAKLIDKLKNFSSLEDLYENIDKNESKYAKLLSNKTNKEVKITNEEKAEINGYQPKSSFEEKKLAKIDQINQTLTHNQKLLSRKRYRSGGGVKQQIELTLDPSERFCKDCLCTHLPNCHVRNRAPRIDYNKIFAPSIPKNQNENKKVNSNQQIMTEKQKRLKDSIKNNKKSNYISNSKQKTQEKSTGLFTKDDFDDKDSFIESDDGEFENIRYKKFISNMKKKINKKRQYDLIASDSDSDDDVIEADFDTIQKEEQISAAIGKYEDKMAKL